MSKNVSTADQIIKAIQLNGGQINSQPYTSDCNLDKARHKRMMLIVMYIAKTYGIENWYTIDERNLNDWIQRVTNMPKKSEQVY
jgi:hypothetical protein